MSIHLNQRTGEFHPCHAERMNANRSKGVMWMIWGLLFVICRIANGQEVQNGTTTTTNELTQWIEGVRSEWQVPGLAVAIVHNDEVVFAQGFGVRALDRAEPVDEHTLFAIASNSKAFTAAAVAILVDEGKLTWDDRVRKHLPYFALSDNYAAEQMTVRDLLCHRSGLGTFSGDLIWYGTPYTPREVLQRAKYLPPATSFRGGYGYSNLMFIAAGEVVAAVSGESWGNFIQKHLLVPLHMDRTVTSVTELVTMENVATPHKNRRVDVVPIPWINWDAMAAAGGIISSVHDMSQWLLVQLRGGTLPQSDSRLWTEDAAWTMWSPHTVIPFGKKSMELFPSTHFRSYGLGWELRDYEGLKMVSHGGAYDGMYSRVTLIPEKKLGIVVLTNSMTSVATPITFTILDRYLALKPRDWNQEIRKQFLVDREGFYRRLDTAVSKIENAPPPSLPLSSYVGVYHCDVYGEVEVRMESDHLVLQLKPYPKLTADLQPLHYDTYLMRWRNEFAWFDEGTAQFVLDSRGAVTDLKLDVPNDDLWFYELPLRRVPTR